MNLSWRVSAGREAGDKAIPARHSLDWQFVASTVSRLLLPLWFVILSALTFRSVASQNILGIDAQIYRHAAELSLSGGNPWAVQPNGVAFAGPPPTLLFYLPAALLPQPIAVLAIVSAGLVAAVWAIRRLELPFWWLLFPPLFEAIIVGNPDALVLALLLVRGPLAGLAAGLKIYAVIPLVLERRWKAVGIAVAVCALSLPLLSTFLANLRWVSTTLDQQNSNLSAWGTWLLIPTIIALAALRRRGAEWLVVPALWPNTQRHYAAISLPAVRRSAIGAAVMSLGIPLAPSAAVIIMAVEAWWRERN